MERIGHRPLIVLVHTGSTGSYIDDQECAAKGLKVEVEDSSEELKVANGSMVKIEGHIQTNLKCGGYHRIVSARVFPQMHKQ